MTLKIPAEGVFIAFEQLIVPENKHLFKYKDYENKEAEGTIFMPLLGLIESTSDDTV